jgi:hypothetical protein
MAFALCAAGPATICVRSMNPARAAGLSGLGTSHMRNHPHLDRARPSPAGIRATLCRCGISGIFLAMARDRISWNQNTPRPCPINNSPPPRVRAGDGIGTHPRSTSIWCNVRKMYGRPLWQAFMEGHRAPLSDHVPLDRALKVVSELAAICPHSSLEIHQERAMRN